MFIRLEGIVSTVLNLMTQCIPSLGSHTAASVGFSPKRAFARNLICQLQFELIVVIDYYLPV